MLEMISPELIALIVAIVIALNTFLFGAYKALEILKDKTKSDLDNKIHGVLAKVLKGLQKIIEIIGANPENVKPVEKKQE